jgi:hypothetical protein
MLGVLNEDLSTFILLTAVRRIFELDKSAKGSHSCFSMTTGNSSVLLTSTFRSTTVHRERTVYVSTTMVTRTRLNVMLYAHYLFYYLAFDLIGEKKIGVRDDHAIWMYLYPV